MPSDANPRYDAVPPIPTYDEAIAGGRPSATGAPEYEARSLLRTHQRSSSTATDPAAESNSPVRSRRNGGSGYRPPTVETDDEDSLFWGSDSDREGGDDEETAHVRREMQELEIMDDDRASGRSRSSIFGKRISLPQWPQWRWKWRWHLPRLRIQLPNANRGASTTGSSPDEPSTNQESSEPQGSGARRWCALLGSVNKNAIFLLLCRLLAVFLILGFLYFIFMSDVFSSMTRRMFDPEAVRQHVQSHVDPRKIAEHLKHFTSYAHIAGTEGDYALAIDVKNMFQKYGLQDITVEEYWVYLNYPVATGRAVEILDGEGKATWAAKIEEEEVGGERAGRETWVFHGHSKSGDVKGPLIYANYGTREDFKRLYDSGIETKGAIALVRQYGPQEDQGLKVKAAELAGFAGCIIYSDPADDGFVKGEPAPKGRYMPADGVQRGSVSLSGWVMGDPLTIGWESTKDLPRLEPEKSAALVKIPSIPLSGRDAQTLLRSLKGAGQQVPPEWVGGVPDVSEWWTGEPSKSPIVRLKNQNDEATKKEIWNIYGRIPGYEQTAKSIIIGNHRDSMAFGAASPHSGTAIMMEMARIFGDLRAKGWQPMRTIDFMSWDGGEFNMAGSTEFVEKNLDSIRKDALAYINLDEAVTGPEFRASGSPVFRRLLRQVLHRVADPTRGDPPVTLRDTWDQQSGGEGKIEGLGADSDHVAFQHLAGTSSLDIRFAGGGTHPRRSSYDNFDWMERHGDPGFTYHSLLGQVLGLLIVELADRPIVPLDMEAFASGLQKWTDEFVTWVESKGANQAGAPAPLDTLALKAVAHEVSVGTQQFAKWEANWESNVMATSGYEPVMLGRQRGNYNSRMGDFDTNMLDLETDGGVPNRTQYKHVVFGPKLWASREPGYFPAVRDAVEAGDWLLANRTLEKAVKVLNAAAAALIE